MTTVRSVYEAFTDVMAEVKAIGKDDRNQQQGFQFRGIDSVMQVVGPVLRAHQVFIIPVGKELKSETYETKSGTTMRNVTVTMQYRVYGPGGDYFDGVSFGEAADVGDKAVTKAQSVAYRTFLLQALTVPTGDPDPDGYAHECAAEPVQSEADIARDQLLIAGTKLGWNGAKLADRFRAVYGGDIRHVSAPVIREFMRAIVREGESQDADE
jgi:hypothetical protein